MRLNNFRNAQLFTNQQPKPILIMRKILLFAFALSFANTLSAQDYIALPISSGFNADVIANGVNPSLLSTTSAMDNANFAFMSADFQAFSGDTPPDYALPMSRTIISPSMPGLTYNFADYSGDNSLRLQEQFDSGTLNFNNSTSFTTLYLLACTGSGNATLGGTIHFSDNTTQEIVTGVIPDWFYSEDLPVVISGFGRVNRDTDVIENPFENPRLYQFQIDILPENQLKAVTSIDFNKQSFEEGVINIFAVSALQLSTCPSPSQLVASAVTNTTAVVSWTQPVILPAQGYQYFLSSEITVPGDATTPTGSVNAGITTVNLDELLIGTTYCIWVRSKCSDNEFSAWSASTCFTTGQTSGQYNDGDIATTFADIDTISTALTTNCPGVLNVTVPDGYQVASVATSYDMQTASNGWMSEQRSLLVCNTTGLMEAEVTAGQGGSTGTYSYNRSGLDIANGATGNVAFELRAWRTYGEGECDVEYNRVVNGTWKVIITYATLQTKTFDADSFKVYPNPAHDVVTVSAKEMISEVAVFNLLGQQVLNQSGLNSKEVQITTAGLPSGKYLMKITSENGVISKSILKN